MDKSLIEKYKTEMLNMYQKNKSPKLQEAPAKVPYIPLPEENEMIHLDPPENESFVSDSKEEGSGKLMVIVTTLRSLYPLKNAHVTVFTGDMENREVAAAGLTDQNGRTDTFVLKTPPRSLSMTSHPDGKPYASYNIEIKADGYIDSIYLDVAVFCGVTSIQRANMILNETAGKSKDPMIFNKSQQYNLGEKKE